MTANSPTQETSLTDQAVAWLQTRLPGGWEIEASDFQAEQDQLRADARINLRGPNGTISTVIVEEKQSVSPRSVLSQLSPRIKTARSMGAHLPCLLYTSDAADDLTRV